MTTVANSTDADELSTAVHEFGHLLGAGDHYYSLGYPSSNELNEAHGSVVFDSNCIYGEGKDDLYTTKYLTICEGCLGVMNGEIDYEDLVAEIPNQEENS